MTVPHITVLLKTTSCNQGIFLTRGCQITTFRYDFSVRSLDPSAVETRKHLLKIFKRTCLTAGFFLSGHIQYFFLVRCPLEYFHESNFLVFSKPFPSSCRQCQLVAAKKANSPIKWAPETFMYKTFEKNVDINGFLRLGLATFLL